MRIVHVAPRYHPHIGSVEYVVKSITKRLAKTGYIITIVTIEPSIDNDRQRK
jgi:glycosyltransferase involved in cell wall biosynthesis